MLRRGSVAAPEQLEADGAAHGLGARGRGRGRLGQRRGGLDIDEPASDHQRSRQRGRRAAPVRRRRADPAAPDRTGRAPPPPSSAGRRPFPPAPPARPADRGSRTGWSPAAHRARAAAPAPHRATPPRSPAPRCRRRRPGSASREVLAQPVEQRLAHAVRRRSQTRLVGHRQLAALPAAADDAHLMGPAMQRSALPDFRNAPRCRRGPAAPWPGRR
jgi:hypothetical protein